MISQKFSYVRAKSLSEAIQLLSKNPGETKLMAGGQSLLPMMKFRLLAPSLVVDIGRIPELSGITTTRTHFQIGACTPHAFLEENVELSKQIPLLSIAAAQIADPSIRNYGTIGGSVVHSDPSADWPAVMLAVDAQFELLSIRGTRTVAARDFFVGTLVSAATDDEVLTYIKIPKPFGECTYAYRKFRHPASGYAVAAAAVILQWQGSRCSGGSIAITGVADKPYRVAPSIEQMLIDHQDSDLDAICKKAFLEIEPLEDQFADGPYRLNLGRTMMKRAIQDASTKIKSTI